jgi:hypothetical protein
MDASTKPGTSSEGGRFHPLDSRTCVAFISVVTMLAIAMCVLAVFVAVVTPGRLPSLSSGLLLVGSIYGAVVVPGFWSRLVSAKQESHGGD